MTRSPALRERRLLVVTARPGSSYHPVSTFTSGSPYGVAVCDGKTDDGI